MLQRELWRNTTLEAGYVANYGYDMLKIQVPNQVLNGDINGNGVDDRVDAQDVAAEGLVRPGIHRERRALRRRQLVDVTFRDIDLRLQAVHARDAECRAAGLDLVADLDVAQRDDAVERRLDLGFLQRQSRQVMCGARAVEFELGALVGLARNEVAPIDGLVALVVLLELVERRLGARHLEGQTLGFELRQYLARAHTLAFLATRCVLAS